MQIKDCYVAKIEGAVFFDPFPIGSKEHWATISEKVRPDIRTSLKDFGYRDKLDITVADNGFSYEYTVDSVSRELQVSRDRVSFDYGRFRVVDGLHKDLGKVVEVVVETLDRDWTEIGSRVNFALPAQDAAGTTVSADILKQKLLSPVQQDLTQIFADGTMVAVDLYLKGTWDKYRMVWNAYNTKEEQHIVVSFDVKTDRYKMEGDSISGFISNVFDMFLARCTPFVEQVLSCVEFAEYLDAEYLIKGER